MAVSAPELIGSRGARLLVVDDLPANVTLLTELLAEWGFDDVVGLTDPTEVAGAIAAAPPDLVLLDLHMPGLTGFELMRQLEPWTQSTAPIPVLVLTADASSETKREALAAGARDFLLKPFDVVELRLRIANLLQVRMLQLALKRQNDQLEQRVSDRTRELEQAKLELADCLALAGEYRDDETQQHALRIGRIAELLGDELGVSEPTRSELSRAASLHDIGKIAVPDAILLKPGPLSPDEFATIKSHTVIGARILSASRSSRLRLAAEIALSHHERWDGAGYPRGLARERIPVAGRIVAVADAFDAITHDRPYKRASPVDAAVTEVLACAGGHFDPQVTAAFAGLDHVRLASPHPSDLDGQPRPGGDVYGTRLGRAGQADATPEVALASTSTTTGLGN